MYSAHFQISDKKKKEKEESTIYQKKKKDIIWQMFYTGNCA